MKLKLEDSIINNYVFQNPYKEYFYNDLYKIKNYVNLNQDKEKYKTQSYSIAGLFNGKERIIDFPNIFTYAYSTCKILKNSNKDFGKIDNSKYNTMNIDFINRKFKANSYSKNLEKKLNLLLNEYEYMYKIDIRNFYKSIYTHVFTKLQNQNGNIDKYIRLYNNNKTNSLLLGNILSTLSANEIMEDMCIKIRDELNNCKIEYFSDQFYIYYNQEHNSNDILNIVKKIIGDDYFEFEINEEDSVLYNHEELIKLRNFRKDLDLLFQIQNITRKDERFFKEHDIEYSSEKIEHYFNSLIEKYYNTPKNKRKIFAEVALKRVFSSTVNLCRLDLLLSDDNNERAERVIEILFMFLNKHSELILMYIKTGIWYVIENSKIYSNKELFYKYSNKFYNKMIFELDKLNSVYDFHIYYLLKNRFNNKREEYLFRNKYENNIKGHNYLLDSIIVSTFKITIRKNEILELDFTKEDWLYNYTVYCNCRFYQYRNDEISKVAINAKYNHLKIIKSLKEIDIDEEIKKDIIKFKSFQK